jgi:hypothetical protein
MKKVVWHFLSGGGYLQMTCPSKCDICPIRFTCYTTREDIHLDKFIEVEDRTLFNKLGKLWGENWSNFPM